MAIQSFTVTRDVDAVDDKGQPVKIALASVIHENGEGETVAVREDLIRFAGESIIETEVRRKVSR
jgi:hypothetical protein